MRREICLPKNKEEWLKLRSRDLTSTKIAALFGLSPYMTEFEMWHKMKSEQEDLRDDIVNNERIRWGSRLETAIALGIAEDKQWVIAPMKEYIRIPEKRIGASFDFAILSVTDPDGSTRNVRGILEIKNVDAMQFKEKWIVEPDGSVSAPPHIELQIQTQLLVSGRKIAMIGALVGGNQIVLLKRIADAQIHAEILKKVAAFWLSIELNQEPKPNFERDAEFVTKLYSHAEPGKVMTATARMDELAEQYNDVSQMMKQLEMKRDAVKAEMLTIMGESEKVLGSNYTITAGMVAPSRVEYDRAGYRTFKVSFKKTKESKG